MADNDLIQQALSRGYSIDEIADKLSANAGIDPLDVRERGYNSNDIISKFGYSVPEQKSKGLLSSIGDAVGFKTVTYNEGRNFKAPEGVTDNTFTAGVADIPAEKRNVLMENSLMRGQDGIESTPQTKEISSLPSVHRVNTPASSFERRKESNRQWLDDRKKFVVDQLSRDNNLSPEDAAVEFDRMRQHGVVPNATESGMRDATWSEALGAGVDKIVPAFNKSMSGLASAKADFTGDMEMSQIASDVRSEAGKQLASADAGFGGSGSDSWKRRVANTLPSISQNLPTIIAVGLTRNPALADIGLAGMGANTFGDSYADGKDSGLNVSNNMQQSALKAIAEVGPERLSLQSMMKLFGEVAGKSATKTIIKQALVSQLNEVGTEELTTMAQFAVDKMYSNPKLTFGDLAKQMEETLYATLIQGPILAGAGSIAASAGSIKPSSFTATGRAAQELNDVVEGSNFAPLQRPGPNTPAADAAKQSAMDAWSNGFAGRPKTVEEKVAPIAAATTVDDAITAATASISDPVQTPNTTAEPINQDDLLSQINQLESDAGIAQETSQDAAIPPTPTQTAPTGVAIQGIDTQSAPVQQAENVSTPDGQGDVAPQYQRLANATPAELILMSQRHANETVRAGAAQELKRREVEYAYKQQQQEIDRQKDDDYVPAVIQQADQLNAQSGAVDRAAGKDNPQQTAMAMALAKAQQRVSKKTDAELRLMAKANPDPVVQEAVKVEQQSRAKPTTQQSIVKRDLSSLAARDDLVGAIMRVTGNQGISSGMAQTITGDKAGAATPKLRGLFLNGGTMDLGDIAELLRVQENFDVRDGDHLSELIRNAAAGDVATSMDRTESDAAAAEEAKRKDYYLKRASELGLKGIGGKRKLEHVVAQVDAKEAEIAAEQERLSKLEAIAEREAIQAADAIDDAIGQDMTEADFMRWISHDLQATYTEEEITRAEQDRTNRENARAEANSAFNAEGEAQSNSGSGNGNQSATPEDNKTQGGARATAETGLTLTGQTQEEVRQQERDRIAAEAEATRQAAQDAADEKAAEKKPLVDTVGPNGSSAVADSLIPRDSRGNSSVVAPVDERKPAGRASEIGDFGEKLGGAKKDRIPSMDTELSDDEIATQPFSKIWPASENEAIEDPFIAAVAHAARAEVPAKPRVGYKLKAWVGKVKALRMMLQNTFTSTLSRDKLRDMLSKWKVLDHFYAKVSLLEAIDRQHWRRIGDVGEYPSAYSYDPSGEKVASPVVTVKIDDKSHRFDGALSVADVVDRVKALLGEDVTAQRMAFEVRGSGKSYSINKKGDREYRKLKTFETSKEAFAFIRDNYDDVVAAWEAVKASDNVSKTDVRNTENRPRTGKDRRNGKDVTEEDFSNAFGFRGVEFGLWVKQGGKAKDRQGMLNQAFDALHDLAEIVGVPPKAISLNGSLGLAFGARGSGNASAHFEPGNLVINLTKTKGAGSLAHEWFHGLDNYFARMRNSGQESSAPNANEYRERNYLTYRPETYYLNPRGERVPARDFELALPGNKGDAFSSDPQERKVAAMRKRVGDPVLWRKVEGVRPEVEQAFADLVAALDASPMRARAAANDKGADGYWSRIIERAARSFENYVITRMQQDGYHNDYLANVRDVEDFPRSNGRYPYLLPEEIKPVAEAFDSLFGTLKTKATDKGVAIYNAIDAAPVPKSEWLSDSQITDAILPVLHRFGRTRIPVRIIEHLSDAALHGVAIDNDITASGFVAKGQIFLVKDGLASSDAVVRTMFHELFHYGLRRFMTRPQYISAMQDLYDASDIIKAVADDYAASSEGAAMRKKGESDDYIRARGVDEALASISEELSKAQIDRKIIAKPSDEMTLIEKIAQWLSSLASKFGFNDLADILKVEKEVIEYRSTKALDNVNPSAAAFVRSILERMENGEAVAKGAMLPYSDAAFMTAWHGSPHDHDKFDSSKIGTGEGAQAYGYGHYFASKREVAEWYRDNLSSRKGADPTSEKFGGKTIMEWYRHWSDMADKAKDPTEFYDRMSILEETELNWNPQAAINTAIEEELSPKAIEWFKITVANKMQRPGRTYQVELAPSEDEYLDWDKPLSEQSELVQKALGISPEDAKRYAELTERIDALSWEKDGLNSKEWNDLVAESKAIRSKMNIDLTGGDFYAKTKNDRADKAAEGSSKKYYQEARWAKDASDYLHSIGIRGIRYLDGNSRNAGDGDRNYVVFNDADVSIIAKYSKGNSAGVPITEQQATSRIASLLGSNVAKTLIDGKWITFADSEAELKRLARGGGKYMTAAQTRLSPNGKPSKLDDKQYRQVRTPEFKAWFGDWEKFASIPGGVWSDSEGLVSKVVDENGEPLVVYHGAKKGGFRKMLPDKADSHRSPMVFAAATRSTAITYSGKGDEIDLDTGLYEDSGEYDTSGDDYDEQRGVYSLFLNIRNPNEANFEGGNWDGSRYGQYRVVNDEDGETIYSEDGKTYFDSESEAEAVASMYEYASVVDASNDFLGETTNSVAEDAKMYGNDGAVIRSVIDDGGQYSGADADDVFVFFNSNQAKSATQNTGSFSASNDDLRYAKQGEALGVTLKDGRIILNLAALTEQNFAGVLKHEGVHSMLKELVGEKTYNQMMRQLELNLKAAKGNEWVTKAHQRAVAAATKAEDVTEEIAGYAVEAVTNGEKTPNFIKRWVGEFLSAIRTALIRGAGGERAKLWAIKHLKPEDMARLAVAGLKAKAGAINAEASQMRMDAAYSKNESQEDKELADTERAYGGREAYDKAKADGKTKLDYRQWVQVRTPKFKAWFGDWEAQAILNADPLVFLSASDAPIGSFNDIEKWAADVFSKQGGKAIRQGFGEVLLDHRAAQTSMAHGGANKYKKIAFAAVKDVIERGALVMSKSDQQEDSFYFSAPINIDGVVNIETVLVHRDPNTQRMYLHSVTTKENLLNQRVSSADTEVSGRSGSTSAGGISIVVQDLLKGNGISKLIDPQTGEPMVVYHGGTVENIFDYKHNGTGSGRESGFFFTPDIRQAKDYAGTGEVKHVYLALSNPVMTDSQLEPDDAKMAAENGHDGYWVVEDGLLDESEIVVFDPTQIKSATGNNSEFDGTNPDIRYSRAAPAKNIAGNQIAQSWQSTDVTGFDDVVRNLQDKLVDTKRVIHAIRENGVTFDERFDPYSQEILFHGRAAKKVHDFADMELKPLLIMMQASGVEMAELQNYLWAAHAHERNLQIGSINPNMPDGGSGLLDQEATAILAGQAVTKNGVEIKIDLAKMAKYKSLGNRIKAITDKTLNELVAYGLETQQTVDAWKAAYKNYVPLMRDMESDDNFSGAFGLGLGTGQGFSVKGSSSRRAMGSERTVTDIIANIAMQRERAIVRGEKNRVALATYGLALKSPNPDFWLPINPNASKQALQNTVQELVNMGLNPIDAEAMALQPKEQYIDPRTGFVSERINPQLRSRDDVLSVRVNGEDRFLVFSSDERAQQMVRNLKNLDAEQLGLMLQNVAGVTRWFASVNTQYNPVFGMVNGVRDFQSAMLNLSSTPLAGHKADVAKYGVSALKGIYSDLRAHRDGKVPTSKWAQEFEEFAQEGGQTGYRDMFQTSKARTDALALAMKELATGKVARFAKISEVNPVFAWLSDYNTSIENAFRLAAYKVAKEQGMSKQQAALLAKNLTVNFNKKGLAATQTGALYAFFNAAVQGTARIGETMTEHRGDPSDWKNIRLNKNGKNIIYGGLILGVMQAVMGALAGWDDDEPPQFQREKNFIIPIPGTDKYASIPMPLGFHVIPNMSRIATEFALGGFKNPGKRMVQLASVFSDSFNPLGSTGNPLQMLSPTITDPLVALSTNEDWNGRQISKKDFNTRNPTPGWTRSKETATPWAKGMSYGINWITGAFGPYEKGLLSPTPDQIDYLIGQVTGGVGREAGKVAQSISATWTGEDLPLYKAPVVGRFVGETKGVSSETSRFYRNLEIIGEHKSPIKLMLEDGQTEKVKQYLKDNPVAALEDDAGRVSRRVSKIDKERREAVDDGDTARVKQLEGQKKTLMKLFNEKARTRIDKTQQASR